ncbi:hypothetical protein [Empedobacter tilapiae]
MLKNLTFLATLFLSSAFAQVEISNKTKPEIDNATDGVFANFSDKGVLLPRIPLKSLTELKNLNGDNFPVQGDQSQMIVYNTNKALGEGYHFWDGTKWRALLDFENVIAQLNSSIMYYKEGSGITIPTYASYDNTSNSQEQIPAYQYQQGVSMLSGDQSKKFLDIPNITQYITVHRNTNKVSFTFTGIAQVESNKSALSFGVGVFVEDKLKYVESFSGTFDETGCGFVNVDLDGILEGLTVGVPHKIEVKFHPRRAYDLNNTGAEREYTFGKKTGSCGNLEDVSMRPKLIITVKE